MPVPNSTPEQPIDSAVLAEFDAEAIDVPLVVGKSAGGIDAVLPWEDMMQQCISKGWEYVDLSDDGEDELGGRLRLLTWSNKATSDDFYCQ